MSSLTVHPKKTLFEVKLLGPLCVLLSEWRQTHRASQGEEVIWGETGQPLPGSPQTRKAGGPSGRAQPQNPPASLSWLSHSLSPLRPRRASEQMFKGQWQGVVGTHALDTRAWGPSGVEEKVTYKDEKLRGASEKTVWCVSCGSHTWPFKGGPYQPSWALCGSPPSSGGFDGGIGAEGLRQGCPELPPPAS